MTDEKKPSLCYLHGLEGSPSGIKGSWMQEVWGARAPELPARLAPEEALEELIAAGKNPACFEPCVEVARAALAAHPPDVLVASSFGAAVACVLMQQRDWTGPCVLLAPATLRLGVAPVLPDGCYAIVIHAPDDPIIPYADGQRIVSANPGRAELWSPIDDHGLGSIVGGEPALLSTAILLQLQRLQDARAENAPVEA